MVWLFLGLVGRSCRPWSLGCWLDRQMIFWLETSAFCLSRRATRLSVIDVLRVEIFFNTQKKCKIGSLSVVSSFPVSSS
jgi:hypothetical protein